jgi:ATP-dependent DNA helicase RecQ
VNLQYLKKSEGEYPTLSIAQKGMELLKSSAPFELPKPKMDNEAVIQKTKRKGMLDYNEDLFAALRELRRGLAAEANVPPFVVFGDVALQEMAYYFPNDAEQFLRITGVGAKKLEKYGSVFLALINDFAEEHQITPVAIGEDEQRETVVVEVKSRKSASILKTKELIRKKVPIARIAKKLGLTQGTVVSHLETLIEGGDSLDLEYLKLPRSRFAAMQSAFEECGHERLKPVFEYLKGEYAYDELKLARVLRMA